MKNLSFDGSDVAGGEQSAVFCLGDEGSDDRDTCRVCGDGVVEGAVIVAVAENVVAAGDAAGTGSEKVRGVRKDAKDHLRRTEDFLFVGVGGGVAEEAVELGDGGGSWGGLFGGQGTGCGQDTGILCPTIVKQIANGYMQFFGLAGSGWRRVVEGG